MPEPLINLLEAPRIIMCPFHVITSAHSNLIICFGTAERNDREVRRICCVRRTPIVPGPRPKMPLLLDVVGQITEADCFLTADGKPAQPDDPEPNQPLASCWIEARPDIVSRIYWRSILPTVQTISEHIPGEVDISRLLSIGTDASVRLQVFWQPPPGETIAETLPMFNAHDDPYVPASLADVPFGRAVRAVFTLEYYHNIETDGPRILFAALRRISEM